MSAKIFALLSLTSPLFATEVTIDIPAIPLPRQATVEKLPLVVIIRGLSQEIIAEQDDEPNVWQRLAISLPDSDLPNLILAPQGEHPEAKYYYRQGERTEEQNDDGSFTVNYTLIIEARRSADFTDLLKGKPQSIRVEVSYHRWQGDRYGEALAVGEQTFLRIDAVPVEAPDGLTISARHQRLHIEWQQTTTTVYSDGQERAVAGVVVIVSEQSDEDISLTAVANQFRSAVDGGDRPLSNEDQCQLSSDCQFECVDNVYLDGDSLPTILPFTKVVQGNSAVIHGLDAGTTYNVSLQYYPDGVARSSCQQGVPIENLTLLELNDEKKAERDDTRCFVATAAYGVNELLDPLYWFRDRILNRHSWGQKVIGFYYQHSPILAQAIANNDWLRVIVQLLLFVPLLIIFCFQYPLLILLPAVVRMLSR